MSQRLKSVAPQESNAHKERLLRRSAHIVVRLFPVKWLPILGEDVVLMDINRGGLKFRKPQRLTMQPGKECWVRILVDMSDDDDAEEQHLICRFSCVWVNEESATFGGRFVTLSDQDQDLLNDWVNSLAKRGKLAH